MIDMEMTSKKIIEVLFNLIIVILFAHPFFLILYTQLSGIDLQNLIAMNPYWNIMFIMSFISPFIGFYVLQLKEKLIKDSKVEIIILQLIVLSIGLFIMKNTKFSVTIYILSLYLFYHCQIKISDLFKYFKKKDFSFKDYLISIGLLLMAVTIRIMINFVSNI